MAKKNNLFWGKVAGRYMTTPSDRNLEKNLRFYDTFEEVKARAKREGRKLQKL